RTVFPLSLILHFEKHPTLHHLFQIEDAPLIQIHFCIQNFQATSQFPEKSESLYQNVFHLGHFYCLYKSAPFSVSLELGDRKSTRLNTSHVSISYLVFC